MRTTWLEKVKQALAGNDMGGVKTLLDSLGKKIAEANRDRDRSTLTADDDGEQFGQSGFATIAKKTMSEVPVYQYRYADLPEQLTGAEIALSSRRRLSPEPTE